MKGGRENGEIEGEKDGEMARRKKRRDGGKEEGMEVEEWISNQCGYCVTYITQQTKMVLAFLSSVF